MPGLVNVHSHLELPPLLNAIKARSYTDWVLNLISAKSSLTQRNYAAAVRSNIRELIRSGTTTIGEICTHNVGPSIVEKSGLRSVIFQEIISMSPSHNSTISSPGSRRSSLIRTGISPHSPHTVSTAELQKIQVFAKRTGKPLAMHVAESKDEIKLLQGKKSGLDKLYEFANWDLDWAPRGSSSFEYLNRIGILSPDLLAVHAVHVSNADIKLIRKSGTAIAHCPRSNHELGVGKMPLKKMLDAGIPVGLGTDSLASVPTLNMWDEMRYALRIHRRDGVSARDIFELATIGGAKALGMDDQIGTLEPGKKADIIAVPLPNKNTGDIYADLLRETKSSIMTMVNGKILTE